ncbi:hypothetical protein EON77_14105 [bacterium]|nr:MAG: hypothetical protein EON77_14105 [bacterium]
MVRAGKPVRNASFSMERGLWGVARIIPGKPFEGRTIIAFDFPNRRDLLMFDSAFRLQNSSRVSSSRVSGDQWVRTAIHEGP